MVELIEQSVPGLEIAVICYYREDAREVSRLFQSKYGKPSLSELTRESPLHRIKRLQVSTVRAYTGKETDVCIVVTGANEITSKKIEDNFLFKASQGRVATSRGRLGTVIIGKMNLLVHQASGPIGDYVKIAAKLTPAIDAEYYFKHIFNTDVHKWYNTNGVLEFDNKSILAECDINRTLEWDKKTTGFANIVHPV